MNIREWLNIKGFKVEVFVPDCPDNPGRCRVALYWGDEDAPYESAVILAIDEVAALLNGMKLLSEELRGAIEKINRSNGVKDPEDIEDVS